jgi:hypothetical protein
MGNTPRAVLLTPGERPSLPLFGTVRQGQCRRGAGKTLEYLLRAYAGSNRNVRPAATQSLSLSTPCGRPCHYRATSCTAPTLLSTQGRDAVTPATVPHTGHCQRPPRALSELLRSTTTPLPSKPLLFGHRTRHDAATGARFVRAATNLTTLFAIPLHV